MHQRQVGVMDPAARILLERAYEAIFDAGYNPQELRGSKTGVYVGTCYAETESISVYKTEKHQSFGILGLVIYYFFLHFDC